MANDNPKNLYDKVCNNILPKIRGRQKGRLYNAIEIIVEEKTKTAEICDYFGIKPHANKDDDQQVINDWVDSLLEKYPPIKFVATTLIHHQGENMEWIFASAALTFVGLFFYKQNLDKKQQNKPNRNTLLEETTDQPIPRSRISVDLCLVIPASIAINFGHTSTLSVSQLKHLIDNASYLLCTDNFDDQVLDLTEDDITTVSEQREVYVRIRIANGEQIIGEKVPYILKGNLPSSEKLTIQKLACLEYLSVSGLEKFNRI